MVASSPHLAKHDSNQNDQHERPGWRTVEKTVDKQQERLDRKRDDHDDADEKIAESVLKHENLLFVPHVLFQQRLRIVCVARQAVKVESVLGSSGKQLLRYALALRPIVVDVKPVPCFVVQAEKQITAQQYDLFQFHQIFFLLFERSGSAPDCLSAAPRFVVNC